MLIYLALFLYGLTLAVVLFLHLRKKEEGQTWLAALFCCFASFALIFLSPLSGTVRGSPFIWFVSNSMILTIDPVWGRFDWLIMVLLSLSTLIFTLVSYLNREKKRFDGRTTSFLFITTMAGILILSTQRLVFLPFLLFLLDCIQIFHQFSEDRELFSTRGQVIPLIIKLSSIILLGYVAILVERTGEVDFVTINPLTLLTLIALMRLLADFLQRITARTKLDSKDRWMTVLNTVFLLKMFSITQSFATMNSNSIVILTVQVLFSVFLLYLWIMRPTERMNDLFASGITITLASGLLFLDIREELMALVLPIIFIWVDQQTEWNKNSLRFLRVIVQSLFLVGAPFSPWYALNKSIVDETLSFSASIPLLVVEGLYLVGFILHQMKGLNGKSHLDSEYRANSESGSLSWLWIALLLAVLLRGFVPSAIWEVSDGLPYVPSVLLLCIPIYLFVNRKTESPARTKPAYHVSGLQITEKATQVILVIVNIFRQIFEGLSALLEGDGGLVWAIILLILLLTFYRGLVG